jgi:hypothetical protein
MARNPVGLLCARTILAANGLRSKTTLLPRRSDKRHHYSIPDTSTISPAPSGRWFRADREVNLSSPSRSARCHPSKRRLEARLPLTTTRPLGILARHPRDGGRCAHTSLGERGPLCSALRTQVGHCAKAEKCQTRTWSCLLTPRRRDYGTYCSPALRMPSRNLAIGPGVYGPYFSIHAIEISGCNSLSLSSSARASSSCPACARLAQ